MKQRGTGLLEERLLGRPSSGGRPDFEHGSPRIRPLIDDGGSRHEGTNNCLSFRTFFARSEGCRHGLKTTHNPKVAGSRSSPRNQRKRRVSDYVANRFVFSAPTLLPRRPAGMATAPSDRVHCPPPCTATLRILPRKA